MFSTLTSSKYPNEEPGERRRKVVSTLLLWIVMVDSEADEPEEDP
jgi:hypothetical protein